MNSTYVLIALGGLAGGVFGCWLVMRSIAIRYANQIRQLEASVQDLQREKLRIEREASGGDQASGEGSRRGTQERACSGV